MRKSIKLLLLTSVFIFWVEDGKACMCNPLGSIESLDDFKRYSFVAHVYISESHQFDTIIKSNEVSAQLLTLEIMRLFLGDTVLKVIDYGSCSYQRLEGEEWLLFIDKGYNYIGLCDRAEKIRDRTGEKVFHGFELYNVEKVFGIKPILPTNGAYRTYYRNGRIEHESFYKDGQLYGEIKDWYPNGQLESIRIRENESNKGTMETYYHNGKLKSVKTYNDSGKVHGISMGYFEHGQTWFKYNSINGEIINVYRTYYDTVLNKNEKNWIIKTYFGGDTTSRAWTKIQIEQEWVYDHKGERAIWREYQRNGQIHKEQIKIEPNGLTMIIYYHNNGKVSSIGYKKGSQGVGHYQEYDEKGNPKRGWDYKEDTIEQR